MYCVSHVLVHVNPLARYKKATTSSVTEQCVYEFIPKVLAVTDNSRGYL